MTLKQSKYNFGDFDIQNIDGVLYAFFIKKPLRSPPSKPNRYSIIKSIDGTHWKEVSDAVLPIRDSWEETIWASTLSHQRGKHVIYYTGATKMGGADGCSIGKAYSKDPVHWEKDKDNPVFRFNAKTSYYSSESRLAFRDPFYFVYRGKRYLLFCAKDKLKSRHQQGFENEYRY
ncbi:MAG: family 43 glycosylhydrolase [Planctomycetes bacterium]|nr:family 43 glycosylhydrolase [Planctomycetota bacterium]